MNFSDGYHRQVKNLRRYRKPMQVIILLAIAAVAVLTLASSLSSKNNVLRVGDEAPDFTLPSLDGQDRALSDYRGQLVIVNFWGTYCPPCVEEMPLIQRYYDEYRDQGLVVLAVNENDPIVSIKAFIRQHKLSFPILLDKDTVRKQYGVTAYPSTFVLDQNGRVLSSREGMIDEAFMNEAVKHLIR